MKKKILVIDDNKDILEPLSLLLEDAGYDVRITTKADQTQNFVDEFSPALILLDILMSGIDGRDICKALKNQDSTKQIPVVMMSAHPTARSDIPKCNANDFIAKPFDLDELLYVVKRNIL